MRLLYEDFDDFDFDDGATARQILREKHREQRRLASRRAYGPGKKRRQEEYDGDYDDYKSYEDYDEYEDYDDGDDDEFDSYSGSRWD